MADSDILTFAAVSKFEDFCKLTGSELVEFSDDRYKCQQDIDFCNPPLDWYLSKGISSDAANHCLSLSHGRTIRGCRAAKGGWVYICHNRNDFISFPYGEDARGRKVALFYDLTWLVRLPGITRTDKGYQIRSLKNRQEIELPCNSCVIPGSGNPSHFVEHFVKHEILATHKDLSDLYPLTFALEEWQRSLVEELAAHYLNRVRRHSFDGQMQRGVYHLRFRDGFIFEDVPQWLGLQHARRILRQSRIATKEPRNIKMLYLCRARTEILNGNDVHRVSDYKDVCDMIKKSGGSVVFPELYKPAQIQHMIASASTVIADPGSCNIHALWSPMIGMHGSKTFYQLTQSEHFETNTYDSYRSFEWFCNLQGSRFWFVLGESEHFRAYSGSVQSARYKDAIAKALSLLE